MTNKRVVPTRVRESSVQPKIQPPNLEEIELLCEAGVPSKVAVKLLRDLGGLMGVARAREVELKRHGVATKIARRIAAALEIDRQVVRPRAPAVNLAEHAHAAVAARLAGLQQEVFLVLSLDIRNGLLDISEVARGSVITVEVHPREIFRAAIRVAAAGIVLVHNHPSGDPTPSPEDIDLTRRIREVGYIVGIPLVDHVVVGGERFRSLAEIMGIKFS